MTSSQTSPPAPWFEQLIRECLATLYLLNLDGCPAADQVGKTATLWVRLLWTKPRAGWHEEADSQRLRDGFKSIAETCKRFPSPAVFLEHLPKRQQPKAHTAIGYGWGRERQAEALEARGWWLESLGLNEAGEPLEAGR